MSQKEAQSKPASMLERELSRDTLMAIKAIVREDRADPAQQEASLDIPSRQGRRLKRNGQLKTEKPMPRVRKVLRGSGDAEQRQQPDDRQSFKSKSALSLTRMAKIMTPRRLAIAVIFAVVLLEPWFIPTVLLISIFLISFVLLALGPDRVKHFADLGWKRYSKRKPEKAKQLRRRATARFERFQKRLDKLPSSWTRGLHMPQVPSETEQTAAETAYTRRMAAMAREERQQSYS